MCAKVRNTCVCVLLLGLAIQSSWTSAAAFEWQDFDLFAVHPDASIQPTVRGRKIRNLIPFQGKLYSGYGDATENTGPITIRGLDTTTGTWSSPELSFSTEAIWHHRVIGGQLYAPTIDPLGLRYENLGGYAVGTPVGNEVVWSQVDRMDALHVFDIATLDGSDLWLTGSLDSYATVWHSTDGGLTFDMERLDYPASGDYARYYSAGVLEGKLYLQRKDHNGAAVNVSLVYDGTSWTSGPDLVPASRFPWRPQEFRGELVYLDFHLGTARMYRFDGSLASLAYSQRMHDFFVTPDMVYGLTDSFKVVASSDLETWVQLGTAPPYASSLAVLESDLYIGTTAAQIYRAAGVISDLYADSDNDGDVDGADFLKWQLGQTPNPLSTEDLNLWEAQFGTINTLSSPVSVPEPSNLVLLLAVFACRKTRRRT